MNFSTNTTAGTIRRSSIYQDNEMSEWEWFGRRLLMMVPYVLAVTAYVVICCFLEEWLNCLREKYCLQTCPTPFRIRGGYRGRASRRGARRRRRGRRRGRSSSASSRERNTTTRNDGQKEGSEKVMAIPTHKMKARGVLCTVCQEEIELDATYKKLPACKHEFHPKCIDKWMKKSKHCPNCRCVSV